MVYVFYNAAFVCSMILSREPYSIGPSNSWRYRVLDITVCVRGTFEMQEMVEAILEGVEGVEVLLDHHIA